MPRISNAAQATADTRHDIVKMIDRIIASNRRFKAKYATDGDPTMIDGPALKGKIEMMAKRAAAAPGGIGSKKK